MERDTDDIIGKEELISATTKGLWFDLLRCL